MKLIRPLMVSGSVRFVNVVVTCKIKLFQKFQNYFTLHRRPSEINLFQRLETCVKLFQKLFQKLIAAHDLFSNMSNVAEIILK